MTSAIATANYAILFRQHFPPRHDGSMLSFFGGAPVAPSGFRWPGSDRGSGASAPFIWKWAQSAQDCPKLLPKWTFQPVAIAIPDHAYDANESDDENPPVLWPGGDVLAEALRDAQAEDVLASDFSIQDFVGADSALRRPFANYPHDWRAIQTCCGND